MIVVGALLGVFGGVLRAAGVAVDDPDVPLMRWCAWAAWAVAALLCCVGAASEL